ncbi:TPR repeat-containing protein [Magnetococcus marinus MC-1]|uniref:TPR repeat-containing protein n=1 Tax=Magnetococcus marinus (strain ATCC BAA-1437 / JCM 17883 / MC-1) TaxID=156889 RepID=A0LC02_MAGMM|nr:nuclear transport factor 2 family protein [Magnetococcus marinus]ABK45495.1 TPR repeat-containing protein [Magnetococcus marinus MC-1]
MRSLSKRLIVVILALLIPSLCLAEDLEAQLDAIHRLVDRQAYAEAQPKLEALVKKHPKNLDVRFLLAVTFAESNQHPKALELFEQLSKEFPRQPEPYNNLGVLYARQGMMDQSRAAFLNAVMSHPSYATAHRNLQAIYANMAARAYGQALEMEEVFDEQPDLAILKKTGSKVQVLVEQDQETLKKLASLQGELEVLRKIRDQAQQTLVRQQEAENRLKLESKQRKQSEEAQSEALKRATAAENELALKSQEIERLTAQYNSRLEKEQSSSATALADLAKQQQQSSQLQEQLAAQLRTLEQARLTSEQALARERANSKKSQEALAQEKHNLEQRLSQLNNQENDQQAVIAKLKSDLLASQQLVSQLQNQQNTSTQSMARLKQDLETEQQRYAKAQSAIENAKARQQQAMLAQEQLNARFAKLNTQIRQLEQSPLASSQSETATTVPAPTPAQTEPANAPEPAVAAPQDSPPKAIVAEPTPKAVQRPELMVSLKTTPVTSYILPDEAEVTVVEDWRDSVRSAVTRWTAAWSNKDISTYLAAYGDGFRPPKGLSLRNWQKQRVQRLTQPRFIQVTLDDVRVVSVHGGRAKVSFVQNYRADSYQDKVSKILLMERQNGQWKIVRELSDG